MPVIDKVWQAKGTWFVGRYGRFSGCGSPRQRSFHRESSKADRLRTLNCASRLVAECTVGGGGRSWPGIARRDPGSDPHSTTGPRPPVRREQWSDQWL